MNYKAISILIFLLPEFFGCGQKQAEYEIHLHSIDQTFYPGHIIDGPDTSFNANRAFVDFTIGYLLESPSDLQYISNRALLPKLERIACDSFEFLVKGELPTDEIVEVHIKTAQFDSSKHIVTRCIDVKYSGEVKKIDGEYPYGGEYATPDREIIFFDIKVNDKLIGIPRSAYQNLFTPNLCNIHNFFRQIEVYASLDGQFIYVYIYGGDAADTYFAKLVFNKKKYLTKIVADYGVLSMHGSFRPNFIGY